MFLKILSVETGEAFLKIFPDKMYVARMNNPYDNERKRAFLKK